MAELRPVIRKLFDPVECADILDHDGFSGHKYFMLLSLTMNLLTGVWDGEFMVVLFNTTGKPCSWPHEFK